jgi:hypothetical protein
MRRRQVLLALAGAAAWPLAARAEQTPSPAQQPAVPVIGFMSGRSLDDSERGNYLVAATGD